MTFEQSKPVYLRMAEARREARFGRVSEEIAAAWSTTMVGRTTPVSESEVDWMLKRVKELKESCHDA